MGMYIDIHLSTLMNVTLLGSSDNVTCDSLRLILDIVPLHHMIRRLVIMSFPASHFYIQHNWLHATYMTISRHTHIQIHTETLDNTH